MSATLARATAIFCSRKKAQKITEYRDTAPSSAGHVVRSARAWPLFIIPVIVSLFAVFRLHGYRMQALCVKRAPAFDHRSAKISDRSVGDLKSTGRMFWKKLDTASWFESFFSLLLKCERSTGEITHPCTYTGASVFDRHQMFCESAARLDGLVNPRWRSNKVEGQIEPEIKRHGPTRVRCWCINASVMCDPRQNETVLKREGAL